MKDIKLKELVNSLESLKILSDQKLPVFTSFKISLFLKNVSPMLESYEKERNKLIAELGTSVKDKDGKETGNFNFEPIKAEEFNKKIHQILDVKLDAGIPDIKIKDLEGVSIEPKHLMALTWLIKE